MRVYTVHLRRPIADPERDVVLVKEGFCWPAFLFGALWALWNRLWLVAGVLICIEAGVNLALPKIGLDEYSTALIGLGLALLAGYLGNEARRWTLFRRGFLEVGVVTGETMDGAERRFWDQRPHLAADLVR